MSLTTCQSSLNDFTTRGSLSFANGISDGQTPVPDPGNTPAANTMVRAKLLTTKWFYAIIAMPCTASNVWILL